MTLSPKHKNKIYKDSTKKKKNPIEQGEGMVLEELSPLVTSRRGKY
jgi:hypothetical protein